MPLPKERPHISHGAQAISIGGGYDQIDRVGWGQFRHRAVLHNFMDPPDGYFRNTSFELGDMRLRYSSEKEFKGSSFTIIQAFALNAQTEDQHSPTWQMRSHIVNFLQKAKWQNNFGLGYAKAFDDLSVYSLVLADTFVDDDEKLGFGIFSGASLGGMYDFAESWKIHARLDHLWPLQSNHDSSFWQGEIQVSSALTTNYSIQFHLHSSKQERSAISEFVFYF